MGIQQCIMMKSSVVQGIKLWKFKKSLVRYMVINKEMMMMIIIIIRE